MDAEKTQKRFSLGSAALGFVSAFVMAMGGTAAWATQFQTKKDAAVQVAEVQKVKEDTNAASARVDDLKSNVARIDATTQRLDEKLDKVLLKLAVRR